MTSMIHAGGFNLAYQWVGRSVNSNSPIIIFLHEGLGCMKQWKNFPQELCKLTGMNGLMYDRYGYGESEALKEPRDAGFLKREACEILPELLEKLGIRQKVLIFGHSDGGTIALFFASCHPEKTAGLIAIAPHVFLEEISIKGISDAVRAFEQGDLEKKLKKHHGEKTRAMFEGWTRVWLDEKNRDWNMYEELESVQAPLLVIQGDRDNYGSFRQVENILNYVSGPSHAIYLKNCGHFPHVEYKDTILHEAVRFINSIHAIV